MTPAAYVRSVLVALQSAGWDSFSIGYSETTTRNLAYVLGELTAVGQETIGVHRSDKAQHSSFLTVVWYEDPNTETDDDTAIESLADYGERIRHVVDSLIHV